MKPANAPRCRPSLQPSLNSEFNYHYAMKLKYLIPTLKNACGAALISRELNATGPRAGFVLGYDTNNEPHILFVEDVANTKRPAHIVEGELLAFDLASVTKTVAALELPQEDAVERMFFSLLCNLGSILICQNSTDHRTTKLANQLNSYAVSGIVSMIAEANSPKKQTELVTSKPLERN